MYHGKGQVENGDKSLISAAFSSNVPAFFGQTSAASIIFAPTAAANGWQTLQAVCRCKVRSCPAIGVRSGTISQIIWQFCPRF
jgi:hypothetical protein